MYFHHGVAYNMSERSVDMDKSDLSYTTRAAGDLTFIFPESQLISEDDQDALDGSEAKILMSCGDPLGYIVVDSDEDGQNILFLEVHPMCRNKGLAKKMLKDHVRADIPSWTYPIDDVARAFFNKVKEDFLPLLTIQEE